MSVKLIGEVDWIVQPGYPELSGQNGDESLSVKVIATARGLADNLPGYGAPYSDDDPFFSSFDYLILTGRSVTAEKGKKTYLVNLTYTASDGVESSPDAPIREEWERDGDEINAPLEQHPKYRVCWDHRLIAREGVTATPTWALTTKTTVIPEAERQDYGWIKRGDTVPEGWGEILENQKPAESYLFGAIIVICIKRCTNKQRLEKDAEKDFTRQEPKETFNLTGDWLRCLSKIRKEGRDWVLTVPYRFSKVVDPVLYD